ncbi:MAG: proline--tRNA ligase, partial [Acutalibacteraceae bacterium]
MAKNNDKKLVKEITSMDEDFAKWYTDIVKKAELIEYTSVKGCMVIRPYGYAIWENIQSILDRMFKETGHENVCMPMFIPESLLQKEKDHVEGFAPEVAWVTHGGNEKLEDRLCVRPTSETLFCEHYANIVHSWRDLPKLYNQWVSVVRWEKTTRPFLRSREFLWQEGHTIHATAEEAIEETERMLNVYAKFCEESLAMPVVKGRKTDSDKFAGAEATYAIEALMHDGKALQAGTSHYFGDGFAKAFDITYTNKENKLVNPFQTSWGVTTRLIGAIIMTHGDDNGLVLPPAVAPIQAVIVPIAQHKPGVLEKAEEIRAALAKSVRVKTDDSDNSPGWKFSEYEMKGVPVRIEIGPRDIENNQCVLVTRHNNEKTIVSLDNLEQAVNDKLKEVHDGLYKKAL